MVCVRVSVLVSVYIIRVHCPLHHTLDTFYGLFAKKLKLHETKIQEFPKYYILSLCMKNLNGEENKAKDTRWKQGG